MQCNYLATNHMTPAQNGSATVHILHYRVNIRIRGGRLPRFLLIWGDPRAWGTRKGTRRGTGSSRKFQRKTRGARKPPLHRKWRRWFKPPKIKWTAGLRLLRDGNERTISQQRLTCSFKRTGDNECPRINCYYSIWGNTASPGCNNIIRL